MSFKIIKIHVDPRFASSQDYVSVLTNPTQNTGEFLQCVCDSISKGVVTPIRLHEIALFFSANGIPETAVSAALASSSSSSSSSSGGSNETPFEINARCGGKPQFKFVVKKIAAPTILKANSVKQLPKVVVKSKETDNGGGGSSNVPVLQQLQNAGRDQQTEIQEKMSSQTLRNQVPAPVKQQEVRKASSNFPDGFPDVEPATASERKQPRQQQSQQQQQQQQQQPFSFPTSFSSSSSSSSTSSPFDFGISNNNASANNLFPVSFDNNDTKGNNVTNNNSNNVAPNFPTTFDSTPPTTSSTTFTEVTTSSAPAFSTNFDSSPVDWMGAPVLSSSNHQQEQQQDQKSKVSFGGFSEAELAKMANEEESAKNANTKKPQYGSIGRARSSTVQKELDALASAFDTALIIPTSSSSSSSSATSASGATGTKNNSNNISSPFDDFGTVAVPRYNATTTTKKDPFDDIFAVKVNNNNNVVVGGDGGDGALFFDLPKPENVEAVPIVPDIDASVVPVSPISVQEILNLGSIGIPQSSINFNSLTMQSSKYICVRISGTASATAASTNTGNGTVMLIDVMDWVKGNPQDPIVHSLDATTCIMNPATNLLAYSRKENRSLTITDLTTKEQVGEYFLTAGAENDVVYWTWISSTTIAFVTTYSVYHWDITSGSSLPQLIFKRDAGLHGGGLSKITGYMSGVGDNLNTTTKSGIDDWCIVTALFPGADKKIVGRIQLYSISKKISQVVEGHAGLLYSPLPGKYKFAFANRGHLFSVDLQTRQTNKTEIKFSEYDTDGKDFPVAIQYGCNYGVLYVVTKLGYVHVVVEDDDETSALTPIWYDQVTINTIFLTAVHPDTSGLIAVTLKGQVYMVAVNNAHLVPYISNTLHNEALAKKVQMKIITSTPVKEGESPADLFDPFA